MTDYKRLANNASGLIGFLAPSYFAWTVYLYSIPQSLATWVMITLNNVIGVALVIADGNKKPWMQVGWFASAVLVVAAILLGDSPWHWGSVETVSFFFCLVALVLWRLFGPRPALICYISAVYISSVPLLVDYWHVPQPTTAWLFSSTVVSCTLALYGAKQRDVAHVLVPACMLVLNGFIVFLCLR